MTYKISVIIPSYNRRKTINRAIDSVLSQRIGSELLVECLVIDDASEDGTSEAVEEKYGEQVVILRNSRNREKSYSRNKGAEAAKGKLVCFLDSDDTLKPNSLTRSIEPYNSGFDGVVFAASQRPGETEQATLKSFSEFMDNPLTVDHYLSNPKMLCNNSFVLPKEKFISIGGYDQRLTNLEDRQLIVKMLSQYSVRCLKHIICEIFRSTNSARKEYKNIIEQYPGFFDSLIEGGFNLLPHQLAEIKNIEDRECLSARYHNKDWAGYIMLYKQLLNCTQYQYIPTKRDKKRQIIAYIKRNLSRVVV